MILWFCGGLVVGVVLGAAVMAMLAMAAKDDNAEDRMNDSEFVCIEAPFYEEVVVDNKVYRYFKPIEPIDKEIG